MRNLLSFHKKPKRHPGANTIAYYKFDGNLNDSSGNNRNLSMYTGSFSYSTLSSGQKYCQLNTSAQAVFSSFPFNRTAYTVSGWCYFDNVTSSTSQIVMDLHTGNNYFPRFYGGGYNTSNKINSVVSFDSYGATGTTNVRYHLVAVYENGVAYSYINGQLIHSQSYSNSDSSGTLCLNGTTNYSSSYRTWGRISELIFENKARTATEVSDYYNLTKGSYGTSESQASSCFLAGTPVLIEGGSKPIDELNVGDIVLSYNKSTGEKEYNKVVDIIEHTETKDLLYTLDIEGQKVEATEFHKFYISDNKEDWRREEIRNLKEGQWVFSIGGAKKINSVESKKFDGPCYNITVDNNHNYFVYDGILVHNTMSIN